MGTVYAATDTRNDITVALKLLHPHLETDESFRDRFQREAHVAALLRSPYTVQLLDYGFEQGRYFLVMKFVEGETVRDALRHGPLPPERALRVAAQVARALEEGEARGVRPESPRLSVSHTAPTWPAMWPRYRTAPRLRGYSRDRFPTTGRAAVAAASSHAGSGAGRVDSRRISGARLSESPEP